MVDIADESLDGSIVDGAAVGDFLLEELERGRDLHMRDIVATIQTDQYRLITAAADAAARHPGRAWNRQDGGRPAPRLVSALQPSRHPRATRRPRRRPEPDVHGVRLARAAGARRERRRAARGRRARRRHRGDAAGMHPTVAALKADLRLVEVIRRAAERQLRLGAGRARRSGSRARSCRCASARCASCWPQHGTTWG